MYFSEAPAAFFNGLNKELSTFKKVVPL